MVTAGKLHGLKLANLITYPLFQHVFKMCARTQRISVVGLLWLWNWKWHYRWDAVHSLGSLLTGMEVPLETREWKTGSLISGSQWQVGRSTFFKDLVDSGKVDLEKEIHNKCLWFCFSGVLESALNDMRKYWNTHYIRQSCHKTVAGVPDTLYFLPENSGGTDCLILFPQEEIDDMRVSSILQHMMRLSFCFHI